MGVHLQQHAGALGHVLGIVADAFEVRGHFHDRQYRAEVDGRGRPQRNDPRGLLVHKFVERVDGDIALADLLGEFLVAGLQRLGGVQMAASTSPPIFMIWA